ncbi:wall-associated receptor kinase 2-like [Typha latifolia]|uniref:wall-associated receptor kinase 2-like n=1 Tax=Typha latifolia TaxID=4733 RepID=UPI003C30BA4B
MMRFLLPLLTLITSSATAASQANMALPGCPSACGNITIPYPFGVGPGCFRDGFRITCDRDMKPGLFGIDVEVVSLSLQPGEVRVRLPVAYECYDKYGATDRDSGKLKLIPNGVYRPSDSHNQFVVIGCNTVAWIQSHEVIDQSYPYEYYTGCVSYCNDKKSVVNGSCTGIGCCQLAIAGNLIDISVGFGGYNHSHILDFSPCSYAFLVDKDWFRFDLANLTMELDTTVPVWLDWAIRDSNLTCEEAKRAAVSYACRSRNSDCYDSINGPGYICNCSQGYLGNPYLDDGCEDIDECDPKKQNPCYGVCTNIPGSYNCTCPPGTDGDATTKNGCRPKDKFTLALKVVTGGSVGIFLALFMCFWVYLGLQKRKLVRTKQRFFEQNGGLLLQQKMHSFRGATFKIYTEEDLEKATNNFDPARVLGRGGHGIVYRGILEDKTIVAIKKSKLMDENLSTEFATEMLILSQINHKNVVKLLGCCLEVKVPMLVYEFVSNGTLYHYIHQEGHESIILFDTRLRIAAESAGALAYMHSSASPPILHGDVKSANILLDDNFTAKVSDFGTSKLAPNDEFGFATLVQGTCGYLDPEYLLTCQLTDKSDVYSFAVVLLELFTRKKALHFDGPEEDRSLAAYFVTALKQGRCLDVLDDQVKEEARIEILEEIVELIMQCLSMSREERPTMKEVAEKLEVIRKLHQHPWDQDPNLEEMKSLLGEVCDISMA